MRIGGLQKCSLIDYPGQVACVIFTQGCNFRCPYCHNRELVIPEYFTPALDEREAFNFLEQRRRYLKHVVITGGEPTVQADLIEFLQHVKMLGYNLKLDTNGSNPDTLAKIMGANLVDYIAMDIKTSFNKYSKAIGCSFPADRIRQSVELIKQSNIPHEFRTTVVRPFCEFKDIAHISKSLDAASLYTLQPFRTSTKLINQKINHTEQYTEEEIQSWATQI